MDRRMMKSTIDFDRHNEAEPTLPESIRYRLDVVFAAAALTVLAGLLIPISVQILDMAWIGSVCLAAAVVVICIVAKSCHDLQGFGFLVGALMLLRIGLTAMTVRKFLVEHTASTVIDILGKSVAGVGAIGGAIVALLLAIVGFGSILPAAKWIRQSAQRYADQILPIKRAALQAELSLKKIPRKKARDILEKIRVEMRFFGSMGAVAVLMRCEAAAGLVMIAVSLTLKVLTDAMAGGYNAEFLNILASNAAGLVIVAVIPSVAANWSCAILNRKDSLCLKTTQSPAGTENNSQKIQLFGSTAENPKQVELLNPDFVDKARSLEQAGEKIAEFEPTKKTPADEIEYPIRDFHCDNTRQYYQQVTDVILSIQKEKQQGILLTSPADMPLSVAAAVNAAIGLAGAGRKVLLIDAEPHRNAAARAFELDPAKTMAGPQETCIGNLSVFTAGHTETQAIQRIGLAMEKLHERFDCILLYGPQRMQILAGKTGHRFHALIFVQSPKNTTSIRLAAITRDFASIIVLPIPTAS
jgi:hypothetical protein